MKSLFARSTPAVLALAVFPSLHAAPPAAADAMSAVEVVGRRASGSYYASEASGTKTDLPLRELPQAVRVMSRQSLDDLGAVRIDDVLDYVGGVSRQNSFGGMWDNIAIRGLAGDMNNGMALLQNGFSANRGFNAPRDTANIERIEFLKGTAASLYGASEPGGTINVVTKSPLWRAAHAAEAYAGSHDFYRTTLDATGPLSGEAAYRLNVALERRAGFREHTTSRRMLLAPALAWKIAPSTRLDYKGELLRHLAPLDRGVVAIGTWLGAVPRERFLGEPSDGAMRVANHGHQLVLDHALNPDWSARLGLSYKRATLDGFSTEPQAALQPDGHTLQRQRRYRDYASDDLTALAELSGRVRTGPVLHQLLAGAEAYRLDFDQRMLRANPSAAAPYAIDVLAPVYGQAPARPLPNTDTHEEQRNRALYVQDTLSLGPQWRALAGVRFDRHRQSLHNRRSGATVAQHPAASSPRIGLSYLANAEWTVFVNGGRSFRANAGADAAGRVFAPERGEALELGVKWENPARSLGATLALYDIRKRNALTADPAAPGYSVAAGKLRSRGMDFDLSGQLGRAWRANASLSLIDATVASDHTLETGGRLLNVPRVNGSLLLMYENATAAGSRFGIGGGLTYSGERLGEARTQAQADLGIGAFELPAYALARLVGYWQLTPRVRLSLDVDNLLDKTYYTSSFQRTWVSPGAPRSVMLGMQAKF